MNEAATHEAAIGAWLLAWFAKRKPGGNGAPVAGLETDYFQAGLIDSFGVMELVGDIENQFGVRFTDRHFQERRFSTIGGLAAIVTELGAN